VAFYQVSHPYQALRRTMLLAVALLLATAGAAAAQWVGSDEFTTSTLEAYSQVTDSSRQRDFGLSETSRRSGTASVGVKNVYQEYFFGYWHNIRTLSDLYSGSYAYTAGYSPVPSTCRNGRFIGDHYSNSSKVGSTVVNPPYDNCP
jgi:hypothetical protein